MARAFVDSFWMHEKNPDKIKEFWDQNNVRLMAWWLEGEPLNVDDSLVKNCTIDERLFSRPELFYVFEATEPFKHYMRYFNGSHYQSQDCDTEDEYDYLKRHGLFTELEKKAQKPDDAWGEDYTMKEIPKDQKPTTPALVCQCWKCHLPELSWRDRLTKVYKL